MPSCSPLLVPMPTRSCGEEAARPSAYWQPKSSSKASELLCLEAADRTKAAAEDDHVTASTRRALEMVVALPVEEARQVVNSDENQALKQVLLNHERKLMYASLPPYCKKHT